MDCYSLYRKDDGGFSVRDLPDFAEQLHFLDIFGDRTFAVARISWILDLEVVNLILT